MVSNSFDRQVLITQISDAAADDLSHAFRRLSAQSDDPVASMAIFTDESGAPIFIMAEFSPNGFSRDEPGYYSASNLEQSDKGRPYKCDLLLEEARKIEHMPFKERSALIIEGLAQAVKKFADSGEFDNSLAPSQRLLMLWVHDTSSFSDKVVSTVQHCNTPEVADWFAANYCDR